MFLHLTLLSPCVMQTFFMLVHQEATKWGMCGEKWNAERILVMINRLISPQSRKEMTSASGPFRCSGIFWMGALVYTGSP